MFDDLPINTWKLPLFSFEIKLSIDMMTLIESRLTQNASIEDTVTISSIELSIDRINKSDVMIFLCREKIYVIYL